MKIARWLLGLGVAGLLIAALLFSGGGDPVEEAAAPVPTAPVEEPAAPAAVAEEPVETDPPPPAAVAPEAPLSGRLQVDGSGRFVPTRHALTWIRSFLLAHRHLPEAEQEARLLEALRAALPETAWPEALDLARRTLAFRQAARKEFSEGSVAPGADLEQRLQWLRELRRAHYGPELAALLFREEEAALELRLAMRRVREDPNLDEEERAARLEGFVAELPEAERRRVERATGHLRLTRDTEELRAAGASEAEIHALRSAQVGEDAARRLAALDEERARWALRVEAYRRERELALGRGVTEIDLEQLREAHFEAAERERVRRLDAISDQRAQP
ncbi:MAG: hypothetical protein CL910_09995 [Deltaproteobacteria bacterium]|jgi:lipase chaperone LimK|nr:hypothetical protein [Deltaproteobacteria bacterium]